MKEGDVLLASLRQSDGVIKDRPVLFLRLVLPFSDFLVFGISTQLHRAAAIDEVIASSDADFRASGLKATSLYGWDTWRRFRNPTFAVESVVSHRPVIDGCSPNCLSFCGRSHDRPTSGCNSTFAPPMATACFT